MRAKGYIVQFHMPGNSLEPFLACFLFLRRSAVTYGRTHATVAPRTLFVAGIGRPGQGVSTDDGARTPPDEGYQERQVKPREARGNGF